LYLKLSNFFLINGIGKTFASFQKKKCPSPFLSTTAASGGARELVIRVHGGAKTIKIYFLGETHMVKNYKNTKKTKKIHSVLCNRLGELASVPDRR
jgi:hypothetical protein